MIIKATFHDNDYKNVLEGFFSKGLYLMLCYIKEGLSESKEDTILYVRYSNTIDKYCKMIQDEKIFEKHTQQDLLNMLGDAFNKYIEENYSNTAKYLKEHLELEIIDSVNDKWENGEVLYFFPMHDKYIIM